MRVFLYQTKKEIKAAHIWLTPHIFKFSKICSIVKSHCQFSSKLTFENVFVFRRIVWCRGCKSDGRLQLVGSLKLDVSFAKYSLFSRALFKKRPIFLGLQERRSVPKKGDHGCTRFARAFRIQILTHNHKIQIYMYVCTCMHLYFCIHIFLYLHRCTYISTYHMRCAEIKATICTRIPYSNSQILRFLVISHGQFWQQSDV